MADIGASNWNETDASNTTAAPDGAPEGMAPSGVNDVLRAHQGAVKRFYSWQSQKTTAGTSSAYILTYSVAPGALVDGMTHLVCFNAANAASATLNVNSLGAKGLYTYQSGAWAAILAGQLQANAVSTVVYDSSSGTYRVMLPPGCQYYNRQTVSAGPAIDVTSIPSTINDLEITVNVAHATTNTQLAMQFYGSGGALDSTAVYAYMNKFVSSAASEAITANGGTTAFLMTGAISNAVNVRAKLSIPAIQHASFTAPVWQVVYFDTAGIAYEFVTGGGFRTVVGPITGFRIVPTTGNVTGTVTVRGYV